MDKMNTTGRINPAYQFPINRDETGAAISGGVFGRFPDAIKLLTLSDVAPPDQSGPCGYDVVWIPAAKIRTPKSDQPAGLAFLRSSIFGTDVDPDGNTIVVEERLIGIPLVKPDTGHPWIITRKDAGTWRDNADAKFAQTMIQAARQQWIAFGAAKLVKNAGMPDHVRRPGVVNDAFLAASRNGDQFGHDADTILLGARFRLKADSGSKRWDLYLGDDGKYIAHTEKEIKALVAAETKAEAEAKVDAKGKKGSRK